MAKETTNNGHRNTFLSHPCDSVTRRHESDTQPGTYPHTLPPSVFTGTITTHDAVAPAMHRDSTVVVDYDRDDLAASTANTTMRTVRLWGSKEW